MSRQKPVDTSYNRIFVIILSLVSTLVIGTLSILTYITWQSNNTTRTIPAVIPPEDPLTPTTKPISRLNLSTPTPIPTLSAEQRETIAEELRDEFPDLPQKALDEILYSLTPSPTNQ